MNKRSNESPRRTRAAKQLNAQRWRTYSLILVCALLMVSGFFLAGRQHFSSIDYGMRNSRLRRQIDDLEAEKRRLLLAREVSLSPAEIKKAIRRNGMADPTVGGEVAQVASSTKEKAIPQNPVQTPAKSLVQKTSEVTVAQRASVVTGSKTAQSIKPIRATMAAE